MDYYSKWIELVKLKNKTSTEIIYRLKNIFSVHGIPEILISDNMPFDSFEFLEFSKSWNFTITTSKESNVDFQLVLLEHRNSPISNLPFAPSQVIFNRLCRSKITISNELLKPKIINNVKSLLLES